MATAIASQLEPIDRNGISSIADGINHTVPTHKEIQTSIAWLSDRKKRNKYTLTQKGKIGYQKSSSKTNTILRIWEDLGEKLKNFA